MKHTEEISSMSPVTSRARCKWATKLVAAAVTLALVGCDSNPGGPAAPSKSSSGPEAASVPTPESVSTKNDLPLKGKPGANRALRIAPSLLRAQ